MHSACRVGVLGAYTQRIIQIMIESVIHYYRREITLIVLGIFILFLGIFLFREYRWMRATSSSVVSEPQPTLNTEQKMQVLERLSGGVGHTETIAAPDPAVVREQERVLDMVEQASVRETKTDLTDKQKLNVLDSL